MGPSFRMLLRIAVVLKVPVITAWTLPSRFFRPSDRRSGSPKDEYIILSSSSSKWSGELGMKGGSWGGHSSRNEFLESDEFKMRSANPSLLAAATVENDNLLENVESPLKTMVFIDGTWLYYTLFERGERCAVSKIYGTDWPNRYAFNWPMLPRVIAKCIEAEMRATMRVRRHVEVVKTVVFTSAKASTPVYSQRIRMFREMQQSNFEVHMSTTEGEREKTVDIALAVEMLHYATTPGAYDVAALVTGDKDFMPAMTRTRQRGKRVAIATMRPNCAKDLVAAQSHVRDFHPVFLESHLPDLLVPLPKSSARRALGASSSSSAFLGFSEAGGGSGGPGGALSQAARAQAEERLVRVICDVVAESHAQRSAPADPADAAAVPAAGGTSAGQYRGASSGSSRGSTTTTTSARSLGRGLCSKTVLLGDEGEGDQGGGFTMEANQALKEYFGGLKRFLMTHPRVFAITESADLVNDRHNFQVSLRSPETAAAAAVAAGLGGGASSAVPGGVPGGVNDSPRAAATATQKYLNSLEEEEEDGESGDDGLEEEEEDEAIEEEEEEEEDDDDLDDGEGEDDEGFGSLGMEDLMILDDDIVNQMLVPEIKEWLRTLGLPRTGRKAVLARRLNEAIAEAREEAMANNAAAAAKSSSSPPTSAKLAAMLDDDEEEDEDDDDEGEEEEEEGGGGEGADGSRGGGDGANLGGLAESMRASSYRKDGGSELATGTTPRAPQQRQQSRPSPQSVGYSRKTSPLEAEVVSLVKAIVQNRGAPYQSPNQDPETRHGSGELWGNAREGPEAQAAMAESLAGQAGHEKEGGAELMVLGSREVGRALKAAPLKSLGSAPALESVKALYGSLAAFLRLFPSDFALVTTEGNSKEFGIVILS